MYVLTVCLDVKAKVRLCERRDDGGDGDDGDDGGNGGGGVASLL